MGAAALVNNVWGACARVHACVCVVCVSPCRREQSNPRNTTKNSNRPYNAFDSGAVPLVHLGYCTGASVRRAQMSAPFSSRSLVD